MIDSSALVTLLVFDDRLADAVEARLRKGDAFFAPSLPDYEVVSALRGIATKDQRLTDEVVAEALADLQDLPMRRMKAEPLMPRVRQLRHSHSSYDASSIALAEALGATLLGCDPWMGTAGGARCRIEILGAA
ncbi:type II toxin-antitoxin system VapC family toxin [Kitasatospora sp. NPDC018619]|uniref:type II toxin-antitoxin system VapC family toxin n=1 Tax=unclassified Kitasatospora TaxID=2633591 RepID=UPI0037A13886